MSQPAMTYEDGPMPQLREIAALPANPIEAARLERARQRIGFIALASSGLKEPPAGITSEQLHEADDHLMELHDFPQTSRNKPLQTRSVQMRKFMAGWTRPEIAADTNNSMNNVYQNRTRFMQSLHTVVTQQQIAEALQTYSGDEALDFASLLPFPKLPEKKIQPVRPPVERVKPAKPEAPVAPAVADTFNEPETEDDEPTDDWEKEIPPADLVRMYLTDIGRVPLLKAEQEVDLSKRIEAGLYAVEKLRQHDAGEIHLTKQMIHNLNIVAVDGARSRNHLLEANLRLVVSLAKRYQGKGLTLLDLIQEGNIGLVRAVEKFDYTKGYKFSTYATWWIRQALQRSIADQGRTIRVPVHMVENINKALRIKRELTNDLGQAPSFAEIGKAMDMTPQRVEEILSYGRETLSLETPVGDDGTATFGEFIEDMDAPIASEVVDFGLLQDRLRSVLGQLHPREQVVLRARFGLDDGRAQTLDEIGRTVGLTRERIRQIERDGLRKLRQNEFAETLKAWL